LSSLAVTRLSLPKALFTASLSTLLSPKRTILLGLAAALFPLIVTPFFALLVRIFEEDFFSTTLETVVFVGMVADAPFSFTDAFFVENFFSAKMAAARFLVVRTMTDPLPTVTMVSMPRETSQMECVFSIHNSTMPFSETTEEAKAGNGARVWPAVCPHD
jgi:hypothetical protein